MLHHESDLRIEEHYTDTAGFTDHVFALCHLLGFRFAPRIRDLADKRLYVPDPHGEYAALAPLVGGRLHLKLILGTIEFRPEPEEIFRCKQPPDRPLKLVRAFAREPQRELETLLR